MIAPNKREVQRDETRRKILAALVESLIRVGYANTTTVEVQRRSGISRGALLHHFPTRDDLFEAAIGYLVECNEEAVRDALTAMSENTPVVERAIAALAESMRRPAYEAELELWAAARTDAGLRRVLRKAERKARRDLARVVENLFGEPWRSAPHFGVVVEMTVELLRGLAISRALRADSAREAALVARWSEIARNLLGNT